MNQDSGCDTTEMPRNIDIRDYNFKNKSAETKTCRKLKTNTENCFGRSP